MITIDLNKNIESSVFFSNDIWCIKRHCI